MDLPFINNNHDSIRVLVLGDLHFKVNNVKECKEMCTSIFRVIEEETPDLIVSMGDTLDRHESIHVVPLTNAIKFLNKLSQYQETISLIGNHDLPNNSTFLSDYHPFVGIETERLTIVNKVMIKEFKDFKFIFVPYVYPGRFQEALDTKKDEIGQLSSIDGIFAHQEFYSTKMGAIISTIGDKYPKDAPFVISGHIHDYTRPQDNIVYVGTPMQHAFGDRDDKTISLFTFKKGIKNPTEKRIDLNLTKKIICKINTKDLLTWIPKEGYLIKLIIEGTNSELKSIMKLDYIKKLSKLGIKIVYNAIDEIKIGITNTINKQEIKLPFQQRLVNSIKDKPKQIKWFNHIFSNK